MTNLKERIKKEMVIDKVSILDESFDVVKNLISISNDGSVSLICSNKNLTNEDRIKLYLIGKLYSKEAEFSKEEDVTNKELEKELGLPAGSIQYSLTILRQSKEIYALTRGAHSVYPNKIAAILETIKTKIGIKDAQ